MATLEKNAKMQLKELADRTPNSKLKTTFREIPMVPRNPGGSNFEATCVFNINGHEYRGVGKHLRNKKESELDACVRILDQLGHRIVQNQQPVPATVIPKARPKPTTTKISNVGMGTAMQTLNLVSSVPKSDTVTDKVVLDDDAIIMEATKYNLNIIGNLQTFCLKSKLPDPKYEFKVLGPSNTLVHVCTCKVANQEFIGTVKQKIAAKKVASLKALQVLQCDAEKTQKPASNSAKTTKTVQVVTPTIQRKVTQVKDKIFYFEHEFLSPKSTADVFFGYFEVPTVKAAIKRLPIDAHAEMKEIKEIEILRKLGHPNLVRYFATEVDLSGATFIAMELAELGTLEETVEKYQDNMQLLKQFLVDIIQGLIALHGKKIIHRDIKPSNILIFGDDKNPVAKLADFGISKECEKFGYGDTTEARGTPVWMAPEALIVFNQAARTPRNNLPGDFKLQPSSDIFSLGLTMFYTMSKSKHPFGEGEINIRYNIINKDPDWSLILQNENVALKHLLKAMLNKTGTDRPEVTNLLKHPFFWKSDQNLKLIINVSGDLKDDKTLRSVRAALNEKYMEYCNKTGISYNWLERICPILKDFMGKRSHPKKYSSSVLMLIEFIRDQDQHYNEWDKCPELYGVDVFGPNGMNYSNYFTKRFPELVTFLYTFFREDCTRGQKLREFYDGRDLKDFTCFETLA